MRSRALAFVLLALAFVLAACGSDQLPPLALEPALGRAVFDRPVEVGAYVDGRTFVAERGGRVWLAGEDGAKALLADFSSLVEAQQGEGLLSVALDPAFEDNHWLWAYYFAADEPWRSTLARFEVRGDVVDLDTALVVLEFAQPGFNQNGGAIRFDSDGLLYLSLGDGSASTDPFLNGQRRETLLAKVIRLDVSAASEAEPYRVPDSNPFVDDPTMPPEVYAWGFRNPFRMAIDPDTGDIWLGDVGVSDAEEVNRVQAGGNYGWSIVEGADRCVRAVECSTEGLEPPVYAYPHEDGRCAVIGGVVYRGDEVPALRGRYLFGDLCTGEVWALPRGGEGDPAPIADLDGMLVTFGVDASGEVLIADHGAGGIYRLVRDD